MIAADELLDTRTLVSRLDQECRRTLSEAAELAYFSHHESLEILHWWAVILRSPPTAVTELLRTHGLDLSLARQQIDMALSELSQVSTMPPAFSEKLVKLLLAAWSVVSIQNEKSLISSEALITAFFEKPELQRAALNNAPAFHSLKVLAFLTAVRARMHKAMRSEDEMTTALQRFTVNLSAKALRAELDPVIGRDQEISQLVEILLRRRQNNPILTGEAGVGKTAIVEGLAQRIAAGNVPAALLGVEICSLDLGLLKAGAGVRGEVESRLKGLMAEIAASVKPVILFIDEAHTLVAGVSSAGEHNDIANLIKPELARGTLRTIAATTWSEYKRYFVKDAALSRRFQLVKVNEPLPEDAKCILQGLVPSLQAHHGVSILPDAIDAAVQLSVRYLPERYLPDKAISILDTTCARAVAAPSGMAQQEIDRNAIASVIADWTGVPSEKMLSDRSDILLSLQAIMEKRIVGQSRAVTALCNQLSACAARLVDPDRPMGVFLLVGPSGVGKTETAHAFAEVFFGGPQFLTVVNMSEYQEAHTVSKLKGAPPGYVGFGQGGVLTEAIRHRPYGVLLLDEVEKSHPDVQDLFLQVLDKGFLEDSEGVRVDFRNVLILLTSNASAELLQQLEDPSTWSDAERNEFEQKLHQDLIKHFRPAFLGRVSVVPYMPLNEEQIRSIIDQRLSALGDRYEKGYGQSISFGSNLVTVVVENCMNAAVGVRLVDQFISEKIVASISKHVLESMVAKRVIEAISVDYQNGEVVVHA